jgi:ADP-heptose:LPS heptosyltransferase
MYNLIRRLDSLLIRFAIFVLHPKPPREAIDLCNIKKILCLKLWGLGNLVVIYPLLYRIKERFPDARITFVTFDVNKGFLEKNKAIDEIVYFRLTVNPFRIIKQFVELLVRFRGQGLDLLVNFETFNNAGALFSYLTGARVRIGFHHKYEGEFYTQVITDSSSKHISEIFSDLLKPLGINDGYRYFDFNELETEEEEKKIRSLLRQHGLEKFICVHSGTSTNFTGKRCREEQLSEVVNLLMDQYGLPVIFTGTQKEKRINERVIKNIRAKEKVANWAGFFNIWEFTKLLMQAHLFISSDTGPVHLAASLGVNEAVFYGPTSPHRYGPLNKNSISFYKNTECSPCVGVNYLNKKCKASFKCLDFVPQEVFKKISEEFFRA